MNALRTHLPMLQSRAIALLAALTFVAPLAASVPLELDPTLHVAIRSRSDVSIFDVAETADGKLILTGNFEYVDGLARPNLARVDANGLIDVDFNPENGLIFSMFDLLPDGKMIGSGSYVDETGIRRSAVFRATADGRRDPAFAPFPATSPIRKVLGLPDGGCYVIRDSAPQANALTVVSRLDANGLPSATFPTLTMSPKFMFAVGPNEELALLAGNSSGPGSLVVLDANAVALPISNGIPFTFHPNSLVYEPDGAIVLCGQTNPFNGPGPGLIRLLPSGVRDPSFSGVGAQPFQSGGSQIERLADGSFVTAGSGNQSVTPHLLHYSAAGVFTKGVFVAHLIEGLTLVPRVFPLPSGGYVTAGRFNMIDGQSAPGIAKMTNAGTVDSAFFADVLARGRVTNLVKFGTTGFMIAGGFSEVSDSTVSNLALLAADDTWPNILPLLPIFPRLAFSSNEGAFVFTAAGTLLGNPTPGFAHIKADGSVDTAFLAGTGLSGFESGFQTPDGKSILVGRFGLPPTPSPIASMMMRVNADGTPDTTFFNHTIITGTVLNGVAPDSQGNLLITGQFTAFQGLPRTGLVRTLPDGIVDASWTPSVGLRTAHSLKVLPDDRFYVVGTRADAPVGSPTTLLRYHSDGTIDESFTVTGLQIVSHYALAPDGSIYVVGGTPPGTPKLTKLDANGALDPSFSYQLDSGAAGLRFDDEGRLLIAGGFTKVGDQTREALARFAPVKFAASIEGPTEFSIRLHATVTLTAKVLGAPGSVTYQWFLNGIAVPSATSASFTINKALPKHEGVYHVEVTSGSETVASLPVSMDISRAKPLPQ